MERNVCRLCAAADRGRSGCTAIHTDTHQGGGTKGQRLLAVWRNQDPTSHAWNQSIMGQQSFGGGRQWTTAEPLRGQYATPTRNSNISTAGPFGVEPKLAVTASGVLLLLTGRPRLYLWLLAAGENPVAGEWRGFDLGALHNEAARTHGAAVPQFPPSFWVCAPVNLKGVGCKCCTDEYMGIVAIDSDQHASSETVVVTCDMLDAPMSNGSLVDTVSSLMLRIKNDDSAVFYPRSLRVIEVVCSKASC